MLYTKNRGGFKKETTRVEHRGAHKHIINMVKEIVGRDSSYQAQSESYENKCTNNQKPESDPKPIMANMSKDGRQPIFCQSVFESVKRSKAASKLFTIQHVIDYSIKSIDNSSKAVKAQRQYVSLLESKLEQLEKQIKIQKEQKAQEKQFQEINSQTLQLQKLIRFYHRARNIIVLQSVQLLECKNIIAEIKPSQNRLKSINSTIAKSEELLEVYRRGIEVGSPRKQNGEFSKAIELSQLKDLCEYQEKTIEFLRKQNQPFNQFNEIKLLRHEINRVCSQNETLLQKLQKLTPKQPLPLSLPLPLPNQQIKKFQNDLTEKQNELQKLQIEVDELRMHLSEQSNKLYTMEEEKKCAMEMAESARERCQDLEQNVVDLELMVQRYQGELHEMKVSTVKAAKKIVINNSDIATTEELCKELKPYPRYQKLLFSIINQYQAKISELRCQVCTQRQLKQKYKQWASEVYNLMQSAQIPAQTLQKHMNELYAFNEKMDCSKIQKFLRQIRAFSIGIDEKDVKEMEAELEEYIVSLKSRNQVIKEADCEDGSSVAVSDTFTDQDFDEE